jgi:putative aldouronate transport system permease protein
LKRLSLANLMITIGLGIFAIIAIFPFYQTLIMSVSTILDKKAGGVMVFPRSIDFSSYAYIFNQGKVVNGLFISILVTVIGTLVNLLVTTTGAYALSKKTMPGRNLIFTCIIFTMFFSGGLIPYYLTIQSLNLQNSLLVMILPTAVNVFNLILMKNFFGSVNPALEESAKIDGAHDVGILIRIVIPVSLPIMATMTLFYAVDRWNEWWLAMLFLNNTDLHPMQLILRNTITDLTQSLSSSTALQYANNFQAVYSDSVKSAMIIVAALPILMVYPFVQKYFNAGIMLGSVKG